MNQQLEVDMIRLAELKKALEDYDDLKKEYEEVRQAVLMGMQAQKSKRTEPINGYFAVRSERRNVSVVDPRAVESWMVENGFAVDEYKKLDTIMVKNLAEAQLKETGEIVPGIQAELTEYVTIKKEGASNAIRKN